MGKLIRNQQESDIIAHSEDIINASKSRANKIIENAEKKYKSVYAERVSTLDIQIIDLLENIQKDYNNQLKAYCENELSNKFKEFFIHTFSKYINSLTEIGIIESMMENYFGNLNSDASKIQVRHRDYIQIKNDYYAKCEAPSMNIEWKRHLVPDELVVENSFLRVVFNKNKMTHYIQKLASV